LPVVKLTTLVGRLPGDLWVQSPEPSAATEIRRLCHDSRRVEAGDLFFALPGRRQNGSAYVGEAWRRGAAAVVVEGAGQVESGAGPLLRARSARRVMALMAALFHGEPSQDLRLTGITGTDGKTSTTWFLHQILTSIGRRTVALGTLGILGEDLRLEPWVEEPSVAPAAAPPTRGGAVPVATAGPGDEPARLWRPTTPEAPLFQATLARLRDRGVQDVVAEVSSHALDQERVFGAQFAVVALTHLSADHLDFHGDARAYREAKAKLFHAGTRGGSLERRPVRAVLNIDDPFGVELAAARPSSETITYGREGRAQVRLLRASAGARGIACNVDFAGHTVEMHTPVTGAFHLENLLAASAIAFSLGVAPQAVAAALPGLVPVPGRFELIRAGQSFSVIVDYAHTADGLRRLLEAVRGLGVGRIVLVFGCGGDRDREKRGPMGEVAGRLADQVIVTSDNPRSEDPAAIARAVAEGVARGGARGEIELDRRAALALGLARMRPGDALVAAGKGAETVQVFADRVAAFDDREALRRLLGAVTASPGGGG
jgi:UDP-N-acetylmuramoyl-L-alanyl-D-glutamate--2,6-diaminopimelate ligase